jgi:hypothetical protein
MNSYIDVGVVRVQRYLARPRRLSTQRGGSAMVTLATTSAPASDIRDGVPNTLDGDQDPVVTYCDELAKRGYPGWQRCDEAGNISGVVSVEHGGVVDDLPGCAALLMAMLRAKLPNAEFEASWVADASDYTTARQRMRAQAPMAIALPQLGDYPGLQPCDECGATPVVDRRKLTDPDTGQPEPKRLCADCSARQDDYGRQWELKQGDTHRIAAAFLVEGRLQAKVTENRVANGAQLGDKQVPVADDFADLADLQRGEDRLNHTAIVWIDGDGIGDLFEHLRADTRQRAVAGLPIAVKDALVNATFAIDDTGSATKPVPVIPHVVGGDDVLVTVPATLAWRFVRTYLEAFETGARECGVDATASAAMVFARHNVPFATQLDRAEHLLREAKRYGAKVRHRLDRDAVAGTSCVGWLDVTREGSLDMPAFHRTLIELEGMAGDLERLRYKPPLEPGGESSGVPVTQRERWIRLLSEGDAVLAQARVRLEAKRAGNAFVAAWPFGGNADLKERLEMLRWWHE